MSFTSNTASTPGPTTFGQSETRSPIDGSILASQSAQSSQPTNPLMPRQKPTIKIRRNIQQQQQQLPLGQQRPGSIRARARA